MTSLSAQIINNAEQFHVVIVLMQKPNECPNLARPLRNESTQQKNVPHSEADAQKWSFSGFHLNLDGEITLINGLKTEWSPT